MPNHVTHRVVVTGTEKQLKRFVKAYIRPGRDGDDHLDFEQVIPMPDSLRKAEESSDGRIGYQAWYGNADEILAYPWVKAKDVKTGAELREFLEKKNPQYKIQADLWKRNIDTYGVPTAYEWNIEYWGTKWNSYHFYWERGPAPVPPGSVFDWSPEEDLSKVRQLEFTFDTAWSPPEPVFMKLSLDNPKLNFKIWSYDDGGNFACQGEYEAGESTYVCQDATEELRKIVYRE